MLPTMIPATATIYFAMNHDAAHPVNAIKIKKSLAISHHVLSSFYMI